MKAARYIFFTNSVGPMVEFYRDVMKMKVLVHPSANSFPWVG